MDDQLTPEQERDALAAELALGLLEGQARADALRLSLNDPAFASLIAAWDEKFAPLHSEWRDATPGDSVWDRIEARLPNGKESGSEIASIKRRLHRWRAGALLTSVLAAGLAVLLLVPPAQLPTPAAPQIAVARLENAEAGPTVLARYNQASGVMRLEISHFEPGPLAPELWVIPEGGAPVSLGQISSEGTAEMQLAQPHRPLLKDGATLAITLEQVSSTPHAAPTSAPVAAGKIITV